MADPKKQPVQKAQKETMDNPEQYPTENKSLFDLYESELNVDPIPMEDLKEDLRDEKDGFHTKDTSSSEKKYKPGM
jgi:hypothetical protein